jgi:predicted KAP-like P-loop ATPase
MVTDKDARDAAVKQIEEFKKEKADEPAGRSVPTEIREFREAYKELIKKAGIKRLVVLIDDLDRCLPQTAIETLEAKRSCSSMPCAKRCGRRRISTCGRRLCRASPRS